MRTTVRGCLLSSIELRHLRAGAVLQHLSVPSAPTVPCSAGSSSLSVFTSLPEPLRWCERLRGAPL